MSDIIKLSAAGYRERVFVKSLLAVRLAPDAERVVREFQGALGTWKYDANEDMVLEPCDCASNRCTWTRPHKVKREGTESARILKDLLGLDDDVTPRPEEVFERMDEVLATKSEHPVRPVHIDSFSAYAEAPPGVVDMPIALARPATADDDAPLQIFTAKNRRALLAKSRRRARLVTVAGRTIEPFDDLQLIEALLETMNRERVRTAIGLMSPADESDRKHGISGHELDVRVKSLQALIAETKARIAAPDDEPFSMIAYAGRRAPLPPFKPGEVTPKEIEEWRAWMRTQPPMERPTMDELVARVGPSLIHRVLERCEEDERRWGPELRVRPEGACPCSECVATGRV